MAGAPSNSGSRRAETTRRTLEAELFQAQKMEAVGTLAGGIAHDFNNILAAIVGNAEMAQAELPASHPSRQDLAEVLRAARRARDLVRQILTFSRKQDAERRPVRVAEVIDDVLKLLRATIPSTIELRRAGKPGPRTTTLPSRRAASLSRSHSAGLAWTAGAAAG